MATDLFGGSGALGAGWTQVVGSFNQAGGNCYANQPSAVSFAAYTGEAVSADQEVTVVYAALGSGHFIGPAARCSSGAHTGVTIDGGSDGFYVSIMTAGSQSQLSGSPFSPPSVGQAVKLQVIGSVVKMFYDAAEIGSWTSPAGLPANGYKGLSGYSDGAGSGVTSWVGTDVGGTTQNLAGDAAGQATAAGELDVAQRRVSGQVGNRANRPGRGPYSTGRYFRPRFEAFTPTTQVHSLAGDAIAQASAAAALQLLIGLAAAAAAVGTATGALSQSTSLAGAGAGAGSAAASLAVDKPLAGAGAAAATAQGEIAKAVQLAVAAAAAAGATASMALSVLLNGAATGQANAAGALSTNGSVDLAGAATGGATAAGDLQITVTLVGAALGVGNATGTLQSSVPLNGAAVALATASGQLALSIALSGAALAQAVASASFAGVVTLGGAAAADAGASGSLFLSVPLAGAAQALASGGGGLVVTLVLGGAAQGQAAASGGLQKAVLLTGAAGGQAAATGLLTVGGVSVSTERAFRCRVVPRRWSARPSSRRST